MIICFANQKGGVGKSLLTRLYANHLSEAGKRVKVYETDPQKTLCDKRTEDINNWGLEEMKYPIIYEKLDTVEESCTFMDRLFSEIEEDPDLSILIDIPGNITDDYLAAIFVYSDYIFCPFSYQSDVLASTSGFIDVVCNRLKSRFNDMQTKMIFIPNMIIKSVGTQRELQEWKQVDEIFKTYGQIAPKVYNAAVLARTGTLENSPRQAKAVELCFSFIDSLLFDSKI